MGNGRSMLALCKKRGIYTGRAVRMISELTLRPVVPGARAAGLPPEWRNLSVERGCCKREAHYVYVGHDLSGSPLSIDVGLCRAHCRGPRRRNLHLSDFRGLSKPSSMLDFLRAKKVRRTDWDAFPDGSCPAGSRCEASRLRVEEISLLEGVRQVEVTEGCHCAPQPHKCIRAPAPKTFFPDSPQERTVDVGRCSGPMGTRDGLLCVPTHFDMVLLKGPNGHQAVQTLERCGQRAACYRVPHIRSYLEVVADGTAEKLHKRIKEIDVGRCLGRCPGLLLDNTCRQRDLPKPDNDLFQAEEGVSGHCTPRRYETHTFRSQGGQLRTVLSVQTCGCGI
ncbi:uncharacterized protein LOC110072654 [Pogona vitticeps]